MKNKNSKQGDLYVSCQYPESYQDCKQEKTKEQTNVNDKVSKCWFCGSSIDGTESYPFCDSGCEGNYLTGSVKCYD